MGVLVITFGWLFFTIGLCGWGWLTARIAAIALRVEIRNHTELGTLFWLGFTTALAVSQLWNFFAPISTTAAIGFWIFGLIGFADLLREFRPSWLQLKNRYSSDTRWMLAVPVLIMLAREATYGPVNWDSGVYHFTTIKWAQSYPVVPGLGNLMGHLAFNQSYFLFVALLDVGPLHGHGFQISNSLLCAAISCQVVSAVYRMWGTSNLHQPGLWMRVALAIAIFYELSDRAGGSRISSPTPDLALSILEAVLTLRLVELVFPAEGTRRPQVWELFLLGILGMAAVTIKLSALVFVFTSFAVAAGIEFLRSERRSLFRPLTVLICAAAILLLPWMGRGIVLSGYPAYPSTIGGLPVDWRVPVEDVQEMYRAIVGWARKPAPGFRAVDTGWEWLGEWSQRAGQRTDVRIFLLTVTAALLCWIVLYWRRGRWWTESTLYWVAPLVPTLVGMVFWFLTAPDLRFLGITPWILPAWLAVWVLGSRSDETLLVVRTIGLPSVVFTCALLVVPGSPKFGIWNYDSLGLAVVPKAKVQTRSTNSGLKVHTPVNNRQIWNAKLPATGFFNPLLQQRTRKLRHGFRTSAPRTRISRFPNPLQPDPSPE